jgi:RNA polymerase sigma-70 factor (ECF subfamily)
MPPGPTLPCTEVPAGTFQSATFQSGTVQSGTAGSNGQPSTDLTWGQIAEQNYSAVFRLAYRLTGNIADAEDLTQDTFARAFPAVDRFRPGGSLAGWLARITTNLFIDSKRRQALIRVEELGQRADNLPDRSPSPEAVAETLTLNQRLQDALAQLSDDSRTVLLMRDVEGRGYAEIAARLGVRIGTVRSRIHRARAQARFALEDDRPE